MGHHPAVMFLGAGARGAPLKEHDGIGAACQRLITPQAHHPRALGWVALPPVDVGWRLLHQHPRATALERPHQIANHTGINHPFGLGCVRVVVIGDDVLLRRPCPIVDRFVEAHEVGRDGHVAALPGAGSLACSSKQASQESEQKRCQSSCWRGIDKSWRRARRLDLFPVAVVLAPEVGAPGCIEGVQRCIALLQPPAEGCGRLSRKSIR